MRLNLAILFVALAMFSCAPKPKTFVGEPIFTIKTSQATYSGDMTDLTFISDTFDIDKLITDEMILAEPDLSLYSYMFNQRYSSESSDYYKEMKEFNVPVVMTARVIRYIDYFTKRIPDVTQRWLDRANKYMYIVEDIFLKEGIPSDLVALAFAESGFNNHAVSRAGATGMWQFMSSTGKLYGMKYDFWVDERRDFETSSMAAARFLKDLYTRFDDWYLALAAYNAGPNRILRASRKHGTDDFFAIAKTRTLALETRDYVPKFIALLVIYKNYLKFGFTAPATPPLMFSTVQLPSQINLYWLAKQLDIEVDKLIELNPSLKLPITPPTEDYSLRVPYGLDNQAMEALNESSEDERLLYKVHYAKSGENIINIAKIYGYDASELKLINGMSDNKIYLSRPVFIPIDGVTDPEINKDFIKALARIAPRYYKVRRGDTFYAIAIKHGLSSNTLRKLNPNISVSKLRIGQQIVVSRGVGSPSEKIKSTTAKKSNVQSNKVVKNKFPMISQTGYNTLKHKVRSGDTLSSISKKYNVKIEQIKKTNKLKSNKLYVGEMLSITR